MIDGHNVVVNINHLIKLWFETSSTVLISKADIWLKSE